MAKSSTSTITRTESSKKDKWQAFVFPAGDHFIGLLWSPAGLRATTFPKQNRSNVKKDLKAKVEGAAIEFVSGLEAAPPWIHRFQRFLLGAASGEVPKPAPNLKYIDAAVLSDFAVQALKLQLGEPVQLKSWSQAIGRSAKDIQFCLDTNPLPILVPCHRVLTKSASNAASAQAQMRLLELEGYEVKPRSLRQRKKMEAGIEELSLRDPKLGLLIKRIGRFRLEPLRELNPFEYLLRSILFQQLNGKAAHSIHEKLKTLYGRKDPNPQELLATSEADLAKVGVSRQKQLAMRDLAKASVEGRVPNHAQMQCMTNEQIIRALTPIRGVGRWTVEMLLIFGLGRVDVFAYDDYAIRKATMILHNREEPFSKQAFAEIANKWRP